MPDEIAMRAAELFVESISNPFKAQEAAREMALRSDLAPDDVEILQRILQPWWDTERDAQALCRYLSALGAIGGQGSVAHRRVVRIAVLCARSALPLVREQDRDEITGILNTLDAWACEKAAETDLQTLRDRTWALWQAAADAAAVVGYSDAAANAAIQAAAAADAAATAAADAAAAAYASANSAFAAYAYAASGTTEWETVRNHRLAHLADMIRGEIPVCPMKLP